jgi:hypothetical protein
VSYFSVVRAFSIFELALFSALLVVWLGHVDEDAEFVLGMSHGIGWILLCILVYAGCRRGDFPWPLLAATVTPLGPVGSTIGFEVIVRRDRAGRSAASPE